MRYKVGDKVRIKDDISACIYINKQGLMDKWQGKVMTIRGYEGGCYKMKEDIYEYRDNNTPGWSWHDDMIEGLAEEPQDVYRSAINTYGQEKQVDIMIEEMSELTKALIKHRRKPSDETLENIQEEIADVKIMMRQGAMMFGEEAVERFIHEKTERLRNGLEGESEIEIICGKHQYFSDKEYLWINPDQIDIKPGDVVIVETKYGEKPAVVMWKGTGKLKEFNQHKKVLRNASSKNGKPIFRLEQHRGNYAMHCDTEEKAKTFLKFLHRCGKNWLSGDSYLAKTGWKLYEKNTCYEFNNGTYCGLDWSKQKKYTILEFDDFDWGDMNE